MGAENSIPEGERRNVKAEAPFLTKYFEEMARMKTAKPDLQKVFVRANRPEKARESKMTQAEILARALERKEAAMIDQLKVYARKAFHHHDKDDSGVLNEAESQILFQNYIHLFVQFQRTHGVEVACAAQAPELEKCIQEAGEDKREEMEAQFKANVDRLQTHIDTALTNYLGNQAALNQRAFEVVDVAQDGLLQEQEVVDALTPKHPQNKKLHEALGCLHYYDDTNGFKRNAAKR